MRGPKISVIGLGFVGLPLAVVNATSGFETIAIDNNKKKLEQLRKGKSDFFEPQLSKFLNESIKTKNIQFSENVEDVLKSDITFLTVGTPSVSNGGIDLTQLKNVVTRLSRILKRKRTKHLVVIKSTVIPTTTLKIIIPKFSNLKNVGVVVNPEFLREGSAINDLINPHLIVIGEANKMDGKKLVEYYKVFHKENLPEIIRTEITTAEMIKYANNAFLVTKISFINSIANVCQNIRNVDVKTIAYAIGKDPRIGPLFLNAGPGFGGSCLPKDLSAWINFSERFGESNQFFKAIKEVNDAQPFKILSIMKKMKLLKRNKVISVLGLSFKKDTDDIREAVSIKLVDKLIQSGLHVRVHDPMALDNFKSLFGNKITYCSNVSQCLRDSECCILLTEWDQYKTLAPNFFKKSMKIPNIIDARRILDNTRFSKLNFHAIGLGI